MSRLEKEPSLGGGQHRGVGEEWGSGKEEGGSWHTNLDSTEGYMSGLRYVCVASED